MNINKKGFTLIELLVVVAIISMLTSVTLSSLSDAKQKGRDTGKIRALQEVRKALQVYATDKNTFPYGAQYPGFATPNLTNALVNNSYIQSVDPTIRYFPMTSSGGFCVSAALNCTGYWLGIALERSDNKVTVSDSDISKGSNYNGNSTDCTGTVTTSPDRCYDIVQ